MHVTIKMFKDFMSVGRRKKIGKELEEVGMTGHDVASVFMFEVHKPITFLKRQK